MTTTEEILPEDSSSIKRWRFARWFGWFVWAYFTFVLIVLTIAVFLLLFNADPDAGFAAWIYRSADRAMEPFRGIFPTETAGNGSVIDFSILFAMIVYGILAGLVHSLVSFFDRKIEKERAEALYVAKEAQRRREYAMATDAEYAEARYRAATDAEAARLASQQAKAQQRTATAAEQLAAEQPEKLAELRAAWDAYAEDVGVVPYE